MTDWSRSQAEKLGLELTDEAFDALGTLESTADEKEVLQQVAGKLSEIDNPSAYIIEQMKNNSKPPRRRQARETKVEEDARKKIASQLAEEERKERSKSPKKRRERSRSRNRSKGKNKELVEELTAWSEELDLGLSSDIIDALTEVPEKDRREIVSTIDAKGVGKDGVRNPPGFIANACRKLGVEVGKSSGSKGGKSGDGGKGSKSGGKGGKSAARAEELGLDLSAEALGALSSLTCYEAMDLLENMEGKGHRGKGIRNPSSYVIHAAERIHASEGGDQGGYDAPTGGGKGSKSSAKARELNIDLDDRALDALASVQLREAYEMLQIIDEKGRGRNGIANPSAYVMKAVTNILADEDQGKGGRGDKGGDKGGKGGGKGGKQGKSAARAEEMGLDLSDEALDALRAVALGEAYEILDDIDRKGVGKGGVRNPSYYIIASVNKRLNSEETYSEPRVPHHVSDYAPPRKGGGKSAAHAAKLGIDLESGAIDALAGMSLRDAKDLIEQVAAKG